MTLMTKDGQAVTPSNNEELFYSLANDLFILLKIPPIAQGGTFQEAVLKMQEVLVQVSMLKGKSAPAQVPPK